MDFEVRPLTEAEWSLWDDIVDGSSQGTVYHKSYWLKESGDRAVIYGCFSGGELYAGIPLVYKQKFGMKIAARFDGTRYGGVLFKNQDSKYVTKLSKEKEASRKIAQRLKADFHVVIFGCSPGSVDLQPFIWEGFSPGLQYTYIIQLSRSLENIWNDMGESTRRSIRKAEKDGIDIVLSDDFNQTCNLVQKTFTRQSKKSHLDSIAFYQNGVLAQRKQCTSFLARNKDGEYIAVAYMVWDNKRRYYQRGGYDFEKGHYGASPLAIWEAIKFAKEKLDLEEFDFEGSMIPPLERFFRGFGGQLTGSYNAMWVKPYLKIALFVKEAGSLYRPRLRL